MTPQTMDLVVALQVALEELGLMKEPDQAVKPDRAEWCREGGTAPTENGETVGGTSEIERYPSVSVKG